MRPMVRRGILVVVASLATGCLHDKTPDVRDDARIVFAVNENGWNSIWTMASDGSDRKRLTSKAPPETDASGSSSPAWSAGREGIAFVSTGDARGEYEAAKEIWTMAADGNNKRRLTTNRVQDLSPTWSPDGGRLAYARNAGWGTEAAFGEIVVLELASGQERVLVSDRRRRRPNFITEVAWSPDGNELTFVRSVVRAGELRPAIFTVATDGRDERLVAENAANPAWSPDGRRIAFTSFRDRFGETCFHECTPSGEIYVSEASGRNARRLTNDPASDGDPTWSPHGTHLVFVSDRSSPREHEYELYVVAAEGGPPSRLTHNDEWDLGPDWR